MEEVTEMRRRAVVGLLERESDLCITDRRGKHREHRTLVPLNNRPR